MTVPAVKPALPKPRAPTAAELVANGAAKAAQAKRPTRATLHLTDQGGGSSVISNPHTDAEGWWASVQEVFGTSSPEFVNDAILKLSTVLGRCDGATGEHGMNAALALIAGIEPQDEAQAAIAVQIAIAHSASVQMTGMALLNANAGHVEAAASFAGIATKLSRTMVAHVEALTKLRGGGRQVIEHRYINVNGNAVVGDNTQAIFGGTPQGVENGKWRQPHGLPDSVRAPSPALLCPEQSREALPVTRDEGAEALPTPRRIEPRRAHGGGKRAVRPRSAD